MNALDLIATSLHQHDDKPNQELAYEIIKSNRTDWVKELVDNLNHKNKDIQSDCIKVLYEIGERGSANLISPYAKDFGNLLQSKNNRLVWGAMIALDTIAAVKPEEVFSLITDIIQTTDKGSVITIDHGVSILAKLSANSNYTSTTFPLLMEQLRKCPSKQLPMYAERSVLAINQSNVSQFSELILSRIPEMERDTQVARLHKVLKQLKKL